MTEEIRVVYCDRISEGRTLKISSVVPDDHMFIYFTARDLQGLIRAAAYWSTGLKIK